MALSQEDDAILQKAASLLAGRWSGEIEDGLYYRMKDLAEREGGGSAIGHDSFTASLIALGDYCQLMAKIRLNLRRSHTLKLPKE